MVKHLARLGLFLLALVASAPALAQSGTSSAGQALPDMVLGRAEAPITIIEYASLTCPHCATFHAQTLPKIQAEWIDTGKAKLVYRDFPFDAAALGAAMLARCAGNERYFGFLSTLFRTQEQWSRAEDPFKALHGIAKLGGVSEAKFKECLSDQKLMTAIQAGRDDAQKRYGIDSTPSFVINGKVVKGALAYDRFAEELNAAAK